MNFTFFTMSFESILLHVNKHISLTKEEEEIFTSMLIEKKVKKKLVLLKPNEICNKSFFITKGCLKSYSIDNNGFEHILQFAPENWWITDMYSLISEKPAMLYIDAIEESTFFILTKENQNELYNKVPKFERYFRILVEKSLVATRLRIMDNMELLAKERYSKFCSVYPTLINTLPQKLIAAYIGVKPEFFSKMRAEFLAKGL
jgi:CRP-like cAMP-binding protein